jgi:hypothetical protein
MFLIPFVLIADDHIYINKNMLVLKVLDTNKEIPLASDVKWLKHIEKSGHIYQEPAFFSDAQVGKSVTVKIVKGQAVEVIIEEYRR